MRLRTFFLLSSSLLATALFAAEAPRFSQSLTAEQRNHTGIDAMTSDQVAALDALVRLNQRQNAAEGHAVAKELSPVAAVATDATAPASFSAALSTDQRRAAGLDSLNNEQVAVIDQLVAAQYTPALPRTSAAAPAVEAVEFFPNRWEVHGEFGLSFGFGSGGYRSRAAWLQSTLLDTKTGTEFSVGIATGKEEGGRGYYPYGRSWDRYGRYGDYDWNSVSFGLTLPPFGSGN